MRSEYGHLSPSNRHDHFRSEGPSTGTAFISVSFNSSGPVTNLECAFSLWGAPSYFRFLWCFISLPPTSVAENERMEKSDIRGRETGAVTLLAAQREATGWDPPEVSKARETGWPRTLKTQGEISGFMGLCAVKIWFLSFPWESEPQHPLEESCP